MNWKHIEHVLCYVGLLCAAIVVLYSGYRTYQLVEEYNRYATLLEPTP